MTTALVIGKFYPPHNGHLALIEHAARYGRAVILVMAATQESIPLANRVDWLRQASSHLPEVTVVGMLDDAPVDYTSSVAWTAHVQAMEVALRVNGLPLPDVVVSSESYGERLAAELGATADVYDPLRSGISVSGTAVRTDVVGRWGQLPEAVRLGLATRIIVVGAESTGTTTLARGLVDHYRSLPGHHGMRRVEEYGREFTYSLYRQTREAAARAGRPTPTLDGLEWTTEQFTAIAAEQTRRENDAARAHPLVIADTDAFATMLWERRYVGSHSTGALTAATSELPRRALYLVTDHVGVPFEQDGWRDGEHIRVTMHDWFVDELTAAGHSWVLLRGSPSERLEYAIATVDAAWRRTCRFDSPEWAESTVLA
ncbi:AAA family ATPase [Gordonia sp. PDNC005]|uniref:AAA family ATPase n=1 Tax=unclassified Gordonia (in: high G+C Gram-positive bacteria) TaxID=2657482 RepID=UPI001964A0AD|nr:AAA family ATPase [Gordonia sp. PDNC005]QRY62138.1 AAA family ATPase [Gordonia sp. PDNC005]